MKREKIADFKKGEFMTVAEGEYSDYCVNGLFKILKTFNANDCLVRWANENKRTINELGTVEDDYDFEGIEFLSWLSQNQYIEDVNYRELHVGSYGETKLSSYENNEPTREPETKNYLYYVRVFCDSADISGGYTEHNSGDEGVGADYNYKYFSTLKEANEYAIIESKRAKKLIGVLNKISNENKRS